MEIVLESYQNVIEPGVILLKSHRGLIESLRKYYRNHDGVLIKLHSNFIGALLKPGVILLKSYWGLIKTESGLIGILLQSCWNCIGEQRLNIQIWRRKRPCNKWSQNITKRFPDFRSGFLLGDGRSSTSPAHACRGCAGPFFFQQGISRHNLGNTKWSQTIKKTGFRIFARDFWLEASNSDISCAYLKGMC